MFFLFDSLLANNGTWMWQKKNNPKIQKCNVSNFTRDFLIIFLQNRLYPDVEFYGWKYSAEKHVLTDKIFLLVFMWASYFIPNLWRVKTGFVRIFDFSQHLGFFIKPWILGNKLNGLTKFAFVTNIYIFNNILIF